MSKSTFTLILLKTLYHTTGMYIVILKVKELLLPQLAAKKSAVSKKTRGVCIREICLYQIPLCSASVPESGASRHKLIMLIHTCT